VKIVMERDALRGEVTELKKRVSMFEHMQTQQQEAMRQKTQLTDELNAARDELAKIKAAGTTSNAEVAALAAAKAELERDLAGALEAVAPLEAKIHELEQGQAMKGMAEKSQEELMNKMRLDMDKQKRTVEKENKKLQEELRVKALEASNATQEMSGALSQSKQVQQMKAMMQKKSKEVVDLRKRLAKYEPDDVPDGDA